MAHPSLQAPWRIDYVRSLEQPETGCFLCAAAEARDESMMRERLVLWQSPKSVVLINRYPYTSGHLLVAPLRHVADLDELDDDEGLDLFRQTAHAQRLLKSVMNPQGFNVGINLGKAAGAGVPGHLHQHIVPRWGGDANYMAVVGEVRILPQAPTDLWTTLRAHELCKPA